MSSSVPASGGPITEAPVGPAPSRRARALAAFATIVVPALAAPLVVAFVLPSRLEGSGGGLTHALAVAADQFPLVATAVVFFALAEIARHWRRMLAPTMADARSKRRTRRWSLFALVVAVGAVMLVRASFIEVVRVIGPSMLPTLEVDDRLVVNRAAYGWALPFARTKHATRAPHRGDIVVLRGTEGAAMKDPQMLVKRVVGVPGDHIAFEDNSIHINNWVVPTCDAGPFAFVSDRLTVRGRLTVEFLGEEVYLTVRKAVERPFPGYTVAPGEVFVMGDDRGLSSDSRAWNEGRGAGVPIVALEGKVTRVLWGGRSDGALDLARFLVRPLSLSVRQPNLDLQPTEERLRACLSNRPKQTTPPPS